MEVFHTGCRQKKSAQWLDDLMCGVQGSSTIVNNYDQLIMIQINPPGLRADGDVIEIHQWVTVRWKDKFLSVVSVVSMTRAACYIPAKVAAPRKN